MSKLFKCPKCKKKVECDDVVVFRKCEKCKINMELQKDKRKIK